MKQSKYESVPIRAEVLDHRVVGEWSQPCLSHSHQITVSVHHVLTQFNTLAPDGSSIDEGEVCGGPGSRDGC